MKLKMHDELISMEIPQKMLELSADFAFSSMKSIKISMNRKFSPNGHHYRPHLTSASSDISNEEHPNVDDCEDEDDDSRASSTLVGHGDLIKTDTKLANGINLPSPPSSTRSSFDNDGVTRDSFISSGDNSDNVADGLFGSYDNDVVLEGQNEVNNEQANNDTFEEDIKFVAENLVKMVADEFDSKETTMDTEEEDAWKDFQIDFEGETILPSGMRLVKGVADMPFYREHSEPRFTNQLNFLKNMLTKFICRYKSAKPFLTPVDSVRFKIPHYYLVIRHPMDLETVKNRLNFHWYRNANECISDLRLIFSNCYQFNSPTDYVYKSGQNLEKYLDDKLKDMPANEVTISNVPPLPNIEEFKKQKDITKRTSSISELSENGDSINMQTFGPIKMTTRSERGVMVRKPSKDLPAPISTPQPKPPSTRKVPLNEAMKYCYDLVKELYSKKHADYAWPFWQPVSMREYPDYLQKIKRPVDLSSIKTNIEVGRYITADDFAKDMRLMFSNCLRYNKPESPIIEQARKLREVFEFKYARMPEDWLHDKLIVHHHTSNGRTTSPSVRQTSASLPTPKLLIDSIKIKKNKSESKKSLKMRSSLDNSGQQMNRFNTPSTSGASGESRMDFLERQVATLTNALQACLGGAYGTGTPEQGGFLNPMMPPTPSIPNGNKPTRGRPRKNGLVEPKNTTTKKTTTKKQTSNRKRKHHLSSDEESDSDEEIGQVAEPFNPEDIDDLKKLKSDLENLRAKDLQNVLRILQSTEPSLRCDDESNVEIDFEALKPKTLVALRKYVTSCMLNAKSSPIRSASSTSQPTTTTTANSSNKRFCHSSNTHRSVSNLDTDCDTTTNINNWSRAGSRASDLQLSESSSSDSEIDD